MGCSPSGESLAHVIVGEVISSNHLDDGVIDRLRIELTGRPVEPIPGEARRLRTAPRYPVSRSAQAVAHHERLDYVSKRGTAMSRMAAKIREA